MVLLACLSNFCMPVAAVYNVTMSRPTIHTTDRGMIMIQLTSRPLIWTYWFHTFETKDVYTRISKKHIHCAPIDVATDYCYDLPSFPSDYQPRGDQPLQTSISRKVSLESFHPNDSQSYFKAPPITSNKYELLHTKNSFFPPLNISSINLRMKRIFQHKELPLSVIKDTSLWVFTEIIPSRNNALSLKQFGLYIPLTLTPLAPSKSFLVLPTPLIQKRLTNRCYGPTLSTSYITQPMQLTFYNNDSIYSVADTSVISSEKIDFSRSTPSLYTLDSSSCLLPNGRHHNAPPCSVFSFTSSIAPVSHIYGDVYRFSGNFSWKFVCTTPQNGTTIRTLFISCLQCFRHIMPCCSFITDSFTLHPLYNTCAFPTQSASPPHLIRILHHDIHKTDPQCPIITRPTIKGYLAQRLTQNSTQLSTPLTIPIWLQIATPLAQLLQWMIIIVLCYKFRSSYYFLSQLQTLAKASATNTTVQYFTCSFPLRLRIFYVVFYVFPYVQAYAYLYFTLET